MDLNQVRQRLDDERRYLARGGETVSVQPHLTRVSNGPLRMVAWSSLDEATADQEIAEEVARHAAEGNSFEWKFYSHDKPINLLARLQRQGLVAGAPEAVMAYDLSAGPPCTVDLCNVVRIARQDQIEHYRRVAEEALGKDYSLTCGQLADALAQRSTQHLGYDASGVSRPRLLPRARCGADGRRHQAGRPLSPRRCTPDKPAYPRAPRL